MLEDEGNPWVISTVEIMTCSHEGETSHLRWERKCLKRVETFDKRSCKPFTQILKCSDVEGFVLEHSFLTLMLHYTVQSIVIFGNYIDCPPPPNRTPSFGNFTSRRGRKLCARTSKSAWKSQNIFMRGLSQANEEFSLNGLVTCWLLIEFYNRHCYIALCLSASALLHV